MDIILGQKFIFGIDDCYPFLTKYLKKLKILNF